MDNFKFDAFGLNGSLESSMAPINVQFELLLELCQSKMANLKVSWVEMQVYSNLSKVYNKPMGRSHACIIW